MRALFTPLLLLCSLSSYAVELPYQTLDGAQGNLSEHLGKWVVINYWATWCPPCMEEIPELIQFHDNHKDRDAVVLGFSMESVSHQKLAKFVDDKNINYSIVPNARSYEEIGNVSGLPTTYVIDPGGEVVASQVGRVTAEMLESFIAKDKQDRAYP